MLGQCGGVETVVATVAIFGLHKELKKTRRKLKSVISLEYMDNSLSTSNV